MNWYLRKLLILLQCYTANASWLYCKYPGIFYTIYKTFSLVNCVTLSYPSLPSDEATKSIYDTDTTDKCITVCE